MLAMCVCVVTGETKEKKVVGGGRGDEEETQGSGTRAGKARNRGPFSRRTINKGLGFF